MLKDPPRLWRARVAALASYERVGDDLLRDAPYPSRRLSALRRVALRRQSIVHPFAPAGQQPLVRYASVAMVVTFRSR